MKKIFFTGGGSGGHVVPAITLINKLKQNRDLEIHYVGSYKGIERELISTCNIKYHPICSGKLRRYFSFQNFLDFFKFVVGIFQALILMIRYCSRDAIVFSTGGFVSVPLVLAGWITGKKLFLHEQTSRVGLANKIASKFAKKIFISFESSAPFFPKEKTILSGYPVRDECFRKDIASVCLNNIKLNEITKPILFVTGGGNGSKLLNDLVDANIGELLKEYFVIHQVGKHFHSQYESSYHDDYLVVPFIKNNMIDIYKLSKVIISRAGAGTVAELIALGKPSVFIPLKIAQKNEQFHNAKEAEKKNKSIIILEDEINNCDLFSVVNKVKNLPVADQIQVENPSDIIINNCDI